MNSNEEKITDELCTREDYFLNKQLVTELIIHIKDSIGYETDQYRDRDILKAEIHDVEVRFDSTSLIFDEIIKFKFTKSEVKILQRILSNKLTAGFLFHRNNESKNRQLMSQLQNIISDPQKFCKTSYVSNVSEVTNKYTSIHKIHREADYALYTGESIWL